jgi:hypothetical protein
MRSEVQGDEGTLDCFVAFSLLLLRCKEHPQVQLQAVQMLSKEAASDLFKAYCTLKIDSLDILVGITPDLHPSVLGV